MDAVMMYGFLAVLLALMTKPLWAIPGAPLWAMPKAFLWLLLALALLLFALATVQSGPLVQTFQGR